ncbi:Foldase protein PrsA precursor [Lachnospiraceae bacterium TWA4]|nr:Foldase protein PrsA precursor [Lachnospiraceae bacterium TWA4]
MQYKKILSLGLAMAMGTTIFSGCSAMEEDSNKVVASYGDEKIYLDEANFTTRYYQYSYEQIYSQLGSSNFWSTDTGNGTMESSLKQSVMAEILQTRVLLEHADEYKVSLTDADQKKVDEAVKNFLENSDEKLIKAAGATEELVKKVYTDNALANKVYQATIANVDTKVSDEEARQVTVKSILISSDNEKYKDGEKTAKEIVEKVKKTKDMDKVVQDYEELSATSGSYSKNGENETNLGKEAAKLSTGDAITYQEEGTGWYAIYCVSDDDKEAAKNEKEEIVEKRQADSFNKTYADWEKKKFKVEDDVWDKVVLSGHEIYVAPTTANESETSNETEQTTKEQETEVSQESKVEETTK